ncbi:hypothetical protein N7478_002360 [Penicillium angulare]|uniref:uncharacterized protein n=1 Tax=Penicillium angulare TaxID=116970 RepID=UPI0025414EB2|nr:uncharacterized protein N7478_002360 [Penicillium angulare]KAJ5286674.1 hypothetical protein N7478_002360 [Penicillium angulare]
MHFNYIALVAGAAIAAADSTVTIFLPGFDAQSIDAKILGSSKSMTTYLLNCPSSEDSNDCGLPDTGLPVTADASTVIFTMIAEDETIAETCTVEGTTSAGCWATEITEGSAVSTISTKVAIVSLPYGGFMPVHVTATETGGASATTGASVSTTTAASTASGSSGVASESTGTASESTGTASHAASSTPEGTSTSSNAGMPMMTANPLWVAGGAAALALAAI